MTLQYNQVYNFAYLKFVQGWKKYENINGIWGFKTFGQSFPEKVWTVYDFPKAKKDEHFKRA